MKYIGDYKIISTIDDDSKGRTVYKAEDMYDNDNKTVVIKVIDASNLSITEKTKLDDEIRFLRKLTKKNTTTYVVKYIDNFIFEDQDKEYMAIVMEDLSNWSTINYLMWIIRNEDPYMIIENDNMKILVRNLLNGLKYIHSKNIAHKDIKCDNIMVDENYNIKFIDFGLSCDNVINCSYVSGTPEYLPPETLQFLLQQDMIDNFDYVDYQKKHDIWSLGIVIYRLCNIQRYPYNFPFKISSFPNYQKELLENVISKKPKKYPSKYMYDYYYKGIDFNLLIDLMLDIDYEKRPGIESLLFIFNNFDISG